MGRHRTVNHDLPPRVQRRVSHTGTTWYYYKHANGYREPLGSDYWAAVDRARGICADSSGSMGTVGDALKVFRTEYLPTLAAGTAYMYERAIVRLSAVFGQATFEGIKKADLTRYVAESGAKVRAVRDIACLSSFWTWALATGRTEVPNPRYGMYFKRQRTEQGAPTHEQFLAVYNHGDQILKNTMDVLYLTGQDVRTVLKWRREHISDGHIDTTRSKTNHPVRIKIEGDLEEVLKQCMKPNSQFLISDSFGRPVTYMQVWNRFKAARKKAGVQFELRGLRRKAGKDHESLTAAQELLGHTNTTTTRNHYRIGEVVKPIRKRVR